MSSVSGFTFMPPSQIGPPSPLLADNIDPRTKDFADLFLGVDPVDAAVIVAVSTTRGSGPCVFNVGVSFTSNKLTDDFTSVMEADVRLALAPLVDRRDIQIIRISFGANGEGVSASDQSGQINIEYCNLRAFDTRVRTLQIPSRRG